MHSKGQSATSSDLLQVEVALVISIASSLFIVHVRGKEKPGAQLVSNFPKSPLGVAGDSLN